MNVDGTSLAAAAGAAKVSFAETRGANVFFLSVAYGLMSFF